MLAAIYNENLARYDWHAPDPDEETCNQTVHVKLEYEVGRLQNRIAHLENQMSTADLDPNELRDLQEIVLDGDDDDEIQFECVMPDPVEIKKETFGDASEFNGSSEWSHSFVNGTDNNNLESDEASNDEESSTTSDQNTSYVNNNDVPAVQNDNVVVSSVVTQQKNPCQTSIYDPVAGYINAITDVSISRA